MQRTAVVSPSSLGALEAYRFIIKDISKVLGDPVVDVAKLFFAVMIQSGLHRFSIADDTSDVVRLALLADRLCSIDYSRINSNLIDVRHSIERGTKDKSLSKQDQFLVLEVVSFIQELYIAAECKKPIATVTDKPAAAVVRRLFRDDMAIVVESLLGAVKAVDVQAPVTRLEVPHSDLKSFRDVMASDVFETYVESHAMFEMVCHSSQGIIERIGSAGQSVVQAFPDLTDLKATTIQGLASIPAIVDATAGKAFGAIARPLINALSHGLACEHQLLIYSFSPTWRQLWGAKLDKVRVLVAEERSRNASSS